MNWLLQELVWWAVGLTAAAIIGLFRHKGMLLPPPADGFGEGLERVERELGARFPGRRPGARSQSAYGTIGDATVAITVETVRDDTNNPVAELAVAVEAPRIPRGIWFAAEGGGGEDVLTGDPVFDDMVEVHGEPSVVLALMSRDVRQKVAVFVGRDGALRLGRLSCHTRFDVPQAEIPALVKMTMELADSLSSSAGGGIVTRLARNATADPLPGVRLLNLLQLHDAFAATREALEASHAARSDSSPWVRLAAARFLRAEVEALEALARDRDVPDQAAAEAVALLAARLSPDRAGPLLLDILKSRTGDAQRQAIEELGALRYGPALGPLIVVMERTDPRTAAAAATALGALGDTRAEDSLLGVLGRDAADVRLGAARALAQLGSVKSVAPLLALLETRGHDADGRQVIRGAIAAIQSRLVGAGAGQLTVASAESESGRLSLAGSDVGALTLADDRVSGSGDK